MIIPGRALDLGLAAFAAAQLGASAWMAPAGDQVLLPGGVNLGTTCWFRTAFQIDCPYCGMTRSFVALGHGDLAAAFRFHPAGPLLFAAMAVGLVALVLVAIRRGKPLVERRRFVLAYEAVALVCLTIGVFKMVRS
jgi:hypothetical protein